MSIFQKVSDFVTGNFGWIWNLSFLLVFGIGVIAIPGFFAKAVLTISFAGKVFEMVAWSRRNS